MAKDTRSIRDRIRKPSGRYKHLGICIFGKIGVGKTTLLGTMPGKGLLLDVKGIEEGDSVVAHHADRIAVLDIATWEDLNKAYHMLRKGQYKCDWVAIDTVTSVQILAKRRVLKLRDDADLKTHQVRRQDWGDIGQLMGELFLKFRSLPMHIVFLSQERTFEHEDGDEPTEILPEVSPASLRILTPSLHLVGRYYIEDVGDGMERRMLVEARPGFVTKARSVKGRELPPIIRKPNLGRILRYMQGDEDVKRPRGVTEASL